MVNSKMVPRGVQRNLFLRVSPNGLYLHICFINIYYIEMIYNLGNKIVVYLICDRINGFVGV